MSYPVCCGADHRHLFFGYSKEEKQRLATILHITDHQGNFLSSFKLSSGQSSKRQALREVNTKH